MRGGFHGHDFHGHGSATTDQPLRIPRLRLRLRLRIRKRFLAGLALAGASLVASPARSGAHEIPTSVTVLAYLRPAGNTLSLLVRVPLEALRDMDFPLRGPGYLDLDGVAPLLPEAAKLWIADAVEVREDGRRLGDARIVATRISLPSDRSFATWDDANAHVSAAPLDAGTQLIWQQAMMDVLIEYPIESATSEFSIRPELARLAVRTTTVLRFLPPNRGERVFRYDGDPGLVRLDPRWHHAALRFVKLGFVHIVDGIDHLLFLLCLVIPFRRFRPLVLVVTSFTVAHSITLIASTAGFAPRTLWFPPLIDTLIAASIVWMALENIVGAKLERRWLYAFGFGLVHGFGFSFALRESLQFAGAHLATSLFAFNIGVELGQLLVIALLVPALAFLFSRVVAERMGVIVLSAIVAHTGWHWMLDRGATLGQYSFAWPAIDFALVAGVMRALMLLAIVAAALWLLRGVFGRLGGATTVESPTGIGVER